MTDKPAFLTPEGKAKLEEELDYLRTTKRQAVADRIKEAKEGGDISESGEYEDAKNEQAQVEGRIREIEQTMKNFRLIDEHNHKKGVVGLGAHVTLIDDLNEEESWTLVGSVEANTREGKISNESPVGSAIMGHKAGEKVNVSLPNGSTILYTIKKVN